MLFLFFFLGKGKNASTTTKHIHVCSVRSLTTQCWRNVSGRKVTSGGRVSMWLWAKPKNAHLSTCSGTNKVTDDLKLDPYEEGQRWEGILQPWGEVAAPSYVHSVLSISHCLKYERVVLQYRFSRPGNWGSEIASVSIICPVCPNTLVLEPSMRY